MIKSLFQFQTWVMKAEEVRTEHGVNHLAATLVVGLKLSQDYYRLLTNNFTNQLRPN